MKKESTGKKALELIKRLQEAKINRDESTLQYISDSSLNGDSKNAKVSFRAMKIDDKKYNTAFAALLSFDCDDK